MDKTILETIGEDTTSNVRTIGEAVDADPVTVDQRCFRLQREGYIRPVGLGHYQLTRQGERRLGRMLTLETE